MKRLMITLMLVMLMCSNAVAEGCFDVRGRALVPNVVGYMQNSSSAFLETLIYVTNISGVEVKCRIRVYDSQGNDVTANSSIYKDAPDSFNSQLVDSGTGDFTIPPNGTREFNFGWPTLPRQVKGHAEIEWTAADKTVRKALIAGTRIVAKPNSTSYYSSHAFINNGQPF